MPIIDTPIFTIEAPEIFEKALWMGQLIRMERMDRVEGESSFAEVNFFVGYVGEERMKFPADSPPEPVMEALWGQYLAQERQVAPVTADNIVEESRQPRSNLALVKLEATSFRPEVGQLIWICLPQLPKGDVGWVFARFILEFDWAQRATYEPLGRAMLASVKWKAGGISSASMEAQRQGAWSIFDEMEPSMKDAIALRYREVLGQVPFAPDEFTKEDPRTIDLRALAPEDVTIEALEGAFVVAGEDSREVMLQTAFLSQPIEFTCYEGGDEDSHHFGEATVAIVRALQALGPEHHGRAGELLWEHCKMCFDATDYGAPESQSNEDFFGIHGPEEAFAEVGVCTIYLSESIPVGSHELFELTFYPPWEDEHGCSLVVRDGELVGTSDPGGWLGGFDPKEASGEDQ